MIWAKKNNEDYQTLINHMLDVYYTSNAIIDINIEKFSKLKSFKPELKEVWSAIIGLHDIGKATPDFQNRIFLNARHEKLSVVILFLYLLDKFKIEKKELLLSTYFQVIKFIILHHSKFITISINDLKSHSPSVPVGDDNWKKKQYNIIDNYLKIISIEINDLKKLSFENISDSAYFSGLMTLADWVGSDINNFQLVNNKYTPEEYSSIAKERALKAVKNIGLNATANIITDDWAKLFPSITNPRKLQQICTNCNLSEEQNLIIIEAPTGEGKTEAAFIISARLNKNKHSGIYVAMPTQATSNGLYDRFFNFIKNADNNENLNLKLIHGATFLKNLKDNIEKTTINAPDIDTVSDAFVWFNKAKKAFLAPYGIGTVDQALYSILLVKHFFLRLFSLTSKTIIFDEVHAYDSYMNDLLIHLIKWLKSLKANVILLSATLPHNTKKRILQAWNENIKDEDINIQYPSLDIASINHIDSYYFEPRYISNKNKNFQIEFCNYEEDEIVNLAEYHLKNKARVLVIVNKVKRAQNIFNKISANNKFLFHSRFTHKDRENIENTILNKYGKNSSDEPSILVSTQIVEQSLDLDFDIIISDLAPIDLLIQRAGRLHRHYKNRPEGYNTPKFIIATHFPENNELPKINDSNIYAPIILYRTFFALKNNAHHWNFHRDFREPVETVYYNISIKDETLLNSELSDNAKEQIKNAINTFNQDTLKAENEAKNVFIPKPNEFQKILSYSEIPRYEDEENGKGLIAKTRLGSDTEKFILLFENNQHYYFEPDYSDEFNINDTLNDELTYKLFCNLISLYSNQANKYLNNQPSWWFELIKNNNMLKHYRILIINKFTPIKYEKNYGLIIED